MHFVHHWKTIKVEPFCVHSWQFLPLGAEIVPFERFRVVRAGTPDERRIPRFGTHFGSRPSLNEKCGRKLSEACTGCSERRTRREYQPIPYASEEPHSTNKILEHAY